MKSIIFESTNREEDLVNRGIEHLVYDYNGKIVELQYAKIWCGINGNYMEPKSASLSNECHICIIL